MPSNSPIGPLERIGFPVGFPPALVAVDNGHALDDVSAVFPLELLADLVDALCGDRGGEIALVIIAVDFDFALGLPADGFDRAAFPRRPRP